MRELTIGNRTIDDSSDAWVIAELGHNHQGNLVTCKQMINAAAEAGAHAVKLQKRHNRGLYTEVAYDRPYTSEHSFGATYGEHRESLEFGADAYRKLDRHADEQGVAFFATPFDHQSADFLAEHTACPAFKIASSDLVNLPLLEYVAAFQRPVILSTGGGSAMDVDRAVNTIARRNARLAILQCTAEYPVRVEHLNLNVIATYRERYQGCVIGLSSHYSGISDAVVAYVLGARIIEKHLTLDRTMKGSDHAFSLEPKGFREMTSYLRNTRLMLGSSDKTFLPEEQTMVDKMRATTRWYQEVINAVR